MLDSVHVYRFCVNFNIVCVKAYRVNETFYRFCQRFSFKKLKLISDDWFRFNLFCVCFHICYMQTIKSDYMNVKNMQRSVCKTVKYCLNVNKCRIYVILATEHKPILIFGEFPNPVQGISIGLQCSLRSVFTKQSQSNRGYCSLHCIVCTRNTCLHIASMNLGSPQHHVAVEECRHVLRSYCKYSRISISRTRITRILRNSKRLSESKIHFDGLLQP